MSELGNKLKTLRGALSQEEFARRVKLSNRTLVKAESGENIRLNTVIDIAKGVKLSEEETLDLIESWIRLQLGNYADRFFIDPKSKQTIMKEKDHLPTQILTEVVNLPIKMQQELLKAVKRPEVLNSLEAFNMAYERLRQERKSD